MSGLTQGNLVAAMRLLIPYTNDDISLNATNVVKTGNMSGTETVLSGTYINGKTTNVIQAGANTTYSAKNYVLLEPKFETQSGAIFKALIGGCN
jgi:hypothetical protein